MRLLATLFLLTATLLVAAPEAARGQVGGRTLGVGAHVGQPVGLSVKFYDRPGAAFDILTAFDLDDFFYVNVHRVLERPLPLGTSVPLRFFHGPGALAGAETGTDNGFALGASYTAGLSLPFDRLEASLQITPRLRVLPETTFSLGGGLGLRYYFSI